MLNTEVYFDIHSINRSLERKITVEEIIGAIENRKARVSRQLNGRFRLSSGNLTLILEYDFGKMKVITVFLTGR